MGHGVFRQCITRSSAAYLNHHIIMYAILLHTVKYIRPNKRVQRTRHKVSGPLTRDVGDKNMKTIIALGILLVTAFITYGDFALAESSGLIVTGAWQFIHADGSITNGMWTHENDDELPMTQEPIEYAKQTGKTGLLVMWWDIERSRRCTIAEYRKGKENGYWVHWYPSGEIQSCGILKNNRHVTGSFWYTNGFPNEIHISTNRFNWEPDGTRNNPQQSGPAYPPQGVGSADP